MRYLLLLATMLSGLAGAIDMGASLSIAPTTVYVNQKMGASLAVWNYNYNANGSLNVLDIIPQTWVTVGGSSTVPVAWDKPALGPGQPTTISPGSSVVYFYQAKFFSPSVSPAYGGNAVPQYSTASLLSVGTQTFSVGAIVRARGVANVAASGQTVKVLPIPLPSSQW